MKIDRTSADESKSIQEILEAQHTRRLMKMLDIARGGSYILNYPFGPEVSASQIIKVLNKREHVPNKREAKKLRQQKAREKKNR